MEFCMVMNKEVIRLQYNKHLSVHRNIHVHIFLIINQNLIKQILAFNESLTPLNYHTDNSNKKKYSYFTLLRRLLFPHKTLSPNKKGSDFLDLP